MGKIIFLLGLAVALASAAPSSKIEPRLAATLAKSSANILVSIKGDTSKVLSTFENAKFATHGARASAVAHSLKSFAKVAQKDAVALLEADKVNHKIFWITNQIYIREATQDIVDKLAALESVKEISEEFEVKIDPIIPGTKTPPTTLANEWGIENVKAPAVWASGNTGEGVVVAGIDTGVRSTHNDLKANWRADYGWYDATVVHSAAPRDGNGHGTHTMGTIVGQNGIGVAPGAQWIACKGLTDQGSGTNAGLIDCGQWVACPTLPDGNDEDCNKAPHVVSNSWGGGQQNAFYNQVITAWKAAGITPVFANGNSGPACTTANSPADSLVEVIAVGATDVGNALAYFSSKGPTVGGRRKPDISAPGLEVRSAWITSDSAYNTISGTSMATPHVAGVVALMRSANANLSFDAISSAINQSANQNTVGSNTPCGGISEDVFPNNSFGHGIIDASGAVSRVVKA